jgi:replicative DNA helicase
MIWYAFTHENAVCLLAAPYENQIKLVFRKLREFIAKSPEIKAAIESDTKHPEFIQFKNGSIISGFTAGTKAGNEGASIRGQRADWIYLDEMDYLSEGDVNAISAIALEDAGRIGIWASSTPTGKRGKFYEWCLEAQGASNLTVEPGPYQGDIWMEYYYPSHCIPAWGPQAEAEFRSMFSDVAYTHEVLAHIGEEMVGVFNKQDVEDACQDYIYNTKPDYAAFRTIGVDWDKYGASTQIVVLEYDMAHQVYKVINRVEIPRSARTLSNAVKTIVQLDKIYNPTHIYVDRGYGELQVEFLSEHVGKKVKGLQFSEKIDVVDPTTKLLDKKHMKPFMVNNAQIIAEQHRIWISKYDDMIKKQMMDYQVVRETILGQPVFTSENEHSLDALMLALLAFTLEHPDIAQIIKKAQYATRVEFVNAPLFARPEDNPRVKSEDEEIVTTIRQSDRYSGAPTWGPRGSTSGRRAISSRKRF